MYSIVYQRLFVSQGLLAPGCVLDQKRSSDQRDLSTGLNSNCKGRGSLHYSSESHAKAATLRMKAGKKKMDWETRPAFLYLSSHRDNCQQSAFAIPKGPSSPVDQEQRRQEAKRMRPQQKKRIGRALPSCVA